MIEVLTIADDEVDYAVQLRDIWGRPAGNTAPALVIRWKLDEVRDFNSMLKVERATLKAGQLLQEGKDEWQWEVRQTQNAHMPPHWQKHSALEQLKVALCELPRRALVWKLQFKGGYCGGVLHHPGAQLPYVLWLGDLKMQLVLRGKSLPSLADSQQTTEGLSDTTAE